jgi:hypothetical protein
MEKRRNRVSSFKEKNRPESCTAAPFIGGKLAKATTTKSATTAENNFTLHLSETSQTCGTRGTKTGTLFHCRLDKLLTVKVFSFLMKLTIVRRQAKLHCTLISFQKCKRHKDYHFS